MIRYIPFMAVLAIGSLAQAQTFQLVPGQGTALFKDMAFSLADLDPTDGITPSLTPNGASYSLTIDAFGLIDGVSLPGRVSTTQTVSEVLPPFHLSLGNSDLGGQADIAPGASLLSPFNLSVKADAAIVPVAGLQTRYTSMAVSLSPNGIDQPSFSLSPHTSLTLRGQLVLHANVPNISLSMAAGEVSLAGFGQVKREHVSLDYFQSDPIEDYTVPISLTLTNDTAQAGDVQFTITAAASAMIQLPPPFIPSAPEPGSWGLALAGLAVIGLAAARKRPA